MGEDLNRDHFLHLTKQNKVSVNICTTPDSHAFLLMVYIAPYRTTSTGSSVTRPLRMGLQVRLVLRDNRRLTHPEKKINEDKREQPYS